MLEAALWYARRGWHVFPLHEPIFDDHGGCTGCSCESYKRSESYRQWATERGKPFDPDYVCPNPGKHPRGSDFDGTFGFKMATTDERQIRHWWGKWANANIGWLPGPSGHAVLDADSYKDEFSGGDILDDETVTQLTGGGGEHYIYQKPEGATYSNAPGDLPAGIDVRADGGYIVVAPSMHPSGRRYQWESGYGPHECKSLLLPQNIHDILIRATESRSKQTYAPSWDGVIKTSAPNLSQWRLPESIIHLISNPPPQGQRSEVDMKIVVTLVYAGAADDDILGVFEHHPIGIAGKFAERGRDYLARTIANARQYVADNPPPPNVQDIIAAARQWIMVTDFAEIIPDELQAENGYRTNETDKAVASAVLDILSDYNYGRGALGGPLGLRQVAESAGRGRSTVKRAIERLSNGFVVKTDREHCYQADSYALHPDLIAQLRTWDTEQKNKDCGTCPIYATTPFHTHKAHDAYARSLSNITQDELDERNALRDKPMRMNVTLRRRLAASLPSAGPGVLILIDALARLGGQATAAELMEATHKKKWSVSRYLKRAADLDLVEYDGSIAQLRDDWSDWTDSIAPFMPTADVGALRQITNANDVMAHCDGLLKLATDRDKRNTLHRRRERAVKHKLSAYLALSPEMSDDELWAIAATTNPVTNWYVAQKMEQFHANARMDLAESRRAEQWETSQNLARAVNSLRAAGVPRRRWFSDLRTAGYTEREAARGVKIVRDY